MFRLLPIQIFIAAIGSVNGIVSTFFASNYIGVTAMTAVGIYGPINILLTTSATILVSGASILCGKYIGQNEQDKMHNVFSLDLVLSFIVGIVFAAVFLLLGGFDLTGFLAHDADVRELFNVYLIGQAVGVIPFIVGNQLTVFLSLENKTRWSFAASILYIAANLMLNILFVKILKWEALGLALASALGMWVFLGIQAIYFITGRSQMRFRLKGMNWDDGGRIFGIGFPGSSTYVYQAVRGLIVNGLLQAYVGAIGISAFTAANNVMAIFWSVPTGMIAVSRMMMSISIGEEDRQSLTDIMRIALGRFLPLQCAVSACIIALAVPFTQIFYRDPSQPVYMMTVWGLRLLPLCMPFSIIFLHFVTYAQASGRKLFVHAMSLLDGCIFVSGFTALLIGTMGMNSVYIANILNGIGTSLIILGYACYKNHKLPSNMEELMVIPDDFGVAENERISLSVRSMEEVVLLSQQIQSFCIERGIDNRRAYLAGLAMEEMAGNIVEHGFTEDNRSHTIDVRVAHKGDEVILRIKDDCIPFDPKSMSEMTDPEDPMKNIGLHMIFGILKDVEYQNILGLNVLMMRI